VSPGRLLAHLAAGAGVSITTVNGRLKIRQADGFGQPGQALLDELRRHRQHITAVVTDGSEWPTPAELDQCWMRGCDLDVTDVTPIAGIGHCRTHAPMVDLPADELLTPEPSHDAQHEAQQPCSPAQRERP
jgi:hypothetical protein